MLPWLHQTIHDLPALPAAPWLSHGEQERLVALHVPKRRNDWLLGRWTAKRLTQRVLAEGGYPLALDAIVITPAPDGAPELSLPPNVPMRHHSLSISHSNARALCALGPQGSAIGADIEQIVNHHPSLVSSYFTAEEQALIAATPSALCATMVTAIWSAKESLLKALRVGLTVETQRVTCLPQTHDLARAQSTWTPLAASAPTLTNLPIQAWWWIYQGSILTIIRVGAGEPCSPAPV
ncbi:MAG: 4'-phosphopantetheinyl transferase superfamily protein [Candidatus Viridilinea halotolerans]|uniref:4'-phosphopantetheinyl transferase superfamily protein n=1 Tax=Candidatus Viridilinea halotolerans TaxID=2491704 RepID=A0A426TSS7_9CHLR|nr:MAG: 4'-phosphopantetheinyl transferase superfamily protein [Candidatus Viridilinea halotolerans]